MPLPAEVARVEDVPPGTATVVQVGDDLALVNVDGTFFAIDNECTHAQRWLPGRGRDQHRLE